MTQTEVYGLGFRSKACSALIKSGLWSKDSVGHQMNHQECNAIRSAYIHKAEHNNERMLIVQYIYYLDANREQIIRPLYFAK
ncbi:hypothetical protein [Yersinia aleksiciae]|uniref:hypothetical protein n=1 Tax=Yersinia aleksiciae TaxID=263819 RepID=UPI0005E5A6CF|nr:hypothetical protein [Yersinia aleksiciae]CFQ50961.1 integrase [Yersinia aleksiciae]